MAFKYKSPDPKIVYFGRFPFVSPEKQGTGPCSPVVCEFVWEGNTEIVFQDSMLSFQSGDGGYDEEGRLYFFSHPSTLTAAAHTRNRVRPPTRTRRSSEWFLSKTIHRCPLKANHILKGMFTWKCKLWSFTHPHIKPAWLAFFSGAQRRYFEM